MIVVRSVGSIVGFKIRNPTTTNALLTPNIGANVGFVGFVKRGGLREERIFRDLWEGETQREVVIESLKAGCEVRTGRPPGL
jgi:hypothetical protein